MNSAQEKSMLDEKEDSMWTRDTRPVDYRAPAILDKSIGALAEIISQQLASFMHLITHTCM